MENTYVARLQYHEAIKRCPRDGDTVPLAVVAQNTMDSVEYLLCGVCGAFIVSDSQNGTELKNKRGRGVVSR